MKAKILAIIFILFIGDSFAQNPLKKQWDKRFGGTGTERMYSASPLICSDNGFLICGNSNSGISGDKTQINWGSTSSVKMDYWVIRIDSLGNKLWDKRYGGIGEESLDFAVRSNNGSFVLAGISNSTVSGDVANINWTGNNDGGVWIIKIDSAGNKIWDKGYETTMYDFLSVFLHTNDGGYMLGFISKSGIGGLKTDSCKGDNDIWIVKLDSIGNKEWDNTYGGINYDGIGDILQTSDNGYLIAGGSESPMGGDKTSEVPGTASSTDMWLIKIDSSGSKQWDQEYGGNLSDGISSIIATSDGNYVLYGFSCSSPSGNKTAICKDTILYANDYWLVKIDSSGNMIWDKSFGGFKIEKTAYGNIIEDKDKGLIFSGISHSNAGADKSENNIPTLVDYQIWLVKSDSLGNKLWDKTVNIDKVMGGFYYSFFSKMILVSPGCFLIQTENNGGIVGEKSQLCWDTIGPSYEDDYWVVKYCDTSFVTSTKKLLPKSRDISLAMQAYPNPFASELYVQLSGKPNNVAATYALLDVSGRLVLPTIESSATSTKINTQKLLPGIYFLHAKTPKEQIVKKLVKL